MLGLEIEVEALGRGELGLAAPAWPSLSTPTPHSAPHPLLEHPAEVSTGCILLAEGEMLGCLQGPGEGAQQAWV